MMSGAAFPIIPCNHIVYTVDSDGSDVLGRSSPFSTNVKFRDFLDIAINTIKIYFNKLT